MDENLMAIKASNNWLPNRLEAILSAKLIDKISAKGIFVYKIDKKSYGRLKSKFFHDVSPLRKDYSPQIFVGLCRKTLRAHLKEKKRQNVLHFPLLIKGKS